jgi:hypothetical protein
MNLPLIIAVTWMGKVSFLRSGLELSCHSDVEKSIRLAKELTRLAERARVILQVGRWLFSNVPQLSV